MPGTTLEVGTPRLAHDSIRLRHPVPLCHADEYDKGNSPLAASRAFSRLVGLRISDSASTAFTA
jgi:hypothetical protein